MVGRGRGRGQLCGGAEGEKSEEAVASVCPPRSQSTPGLRDSEEAPARGVGGRDAVGNKRCCTVRSLAVGYERCSTVRSVAVGNERCSTVRSAVGNERCSTVRSAAVGNERCSTVRSVMGDGRTQTLGHAKMIFCLRECNSNGLFRIPIRQVLEEIRRRRGEAGVVGWGWGQLCGRAEGEKSICISWLLNPIIWDH